MWHADGKESSGGHFAGPAGQRAIGAKLFIDFFLTINILVLLVKFGGQC